MAMPSQSASKLLVYSAPEDSIAVDAQDEDFVVVSPHGQRKKQHIDEEIEHSAFDAPQPHIFQHDDKFVKKKDFGLKRKKSGNVFERLHTKRELPEETEEEKKMREEQELQRKKLTEMIKKSQKAEQELLQKVSEGGEVPFSSVSVFKRSAKRKAEKKYIDAILQKIKKRTDNINTLTLSKKEKPLQANSERGKFLDKSKARARQNYKEKINQERVESIKMAAQQKMEKLVDEYKYKIDKMESGREDLIKINKQLEEKLLRAEEEMSSLKYTIQILRQKLERVQAREIVNQTKLKKFQEYEPLFKQLCQNFNFKNAEQVIKRLEMLEKAQVDSYTQLLEAQEQKNKLERLLEKTKRELEEKSREKVRELQKTLEKSEKRCAELAQHVKQYQKNLERSESYQERYLTLNSAVIDLYTTWMKDLKTQGLRDATKLDEPDHANSTQLISAIKNLLIAFTPTKAGQEFIMIAALANKYWAKYFNYDPSLKSKPKEILAKLEDLLIKNAEEIERLQKTVQHLTTDKKYLAIDLEKTKRAKSAAEAALETHMSFYKFRENRWASPVPSKANLQTRPQTTVGRIKPSRQKTKSRASTRPKSAPGRTLKRTFKKKQNIQFTDSSESSSKDGRSITRAATPNKMSLGVADSFFITQQKYENMFK